MSKKILTQEEKLHAVVIADSFNTRFRPLTLTKPRVLLPLVNRPMLDYTLEFLNISGVQETFIFCCSHAQQIRDYISSSRWSLPNSSMQISVYSSETFQSMGDVLRELDAKALIRSDFVLLFGDCIANLSLKDVLEQHKKNRQHDKGCVMTTVLRKANPFHRTKSIEDDIIYVLDSSTNQILHCERMSNYSKFTVPLNILQSNSNVSIRYDLLETHISICSVKMPLVFSDNYDYETRDDFIHGILGDEITGNSVYVHITDKDYASRVLNISTYDKVSRDILQRLAYPTVPDIQTRSFYQRHNIYKQSGVHLTMDSLIKQNVAIGSNTIIGNNSLISNSTIGSDCRIGDNVIIEDSFIWDNVVIESKCKLKTCIIADNVTLKQNVTINPASIISYNVVIGPNIQVKESSFIYLDDSHQCQNQCDKSLVGNEGKGILYQKDDDEDEDDEDVVQDVWAQNIDYDECDKWSTSTTFSENSSDAERNDSPVQDEIKMFYDEVVESLQSGIEEKVNCENLILEVNSRKYAYNVTMNELNMLLIKAILDLPFSTKKANSSNYYQILNSCIVHLTPLIKNYIRSIESQNDCVTAVEEYCLLHQDVFTPTILTRVMKTFYDDDILDENVIINWFDKPRPFGDIAQIEQERLRKQNVLQKFIIWLKEADEESSSE